MNKFSETIIPHEAATFKDILQWVLRMVAKSFASHLGYLLTAMDQALAVRNKLCYTMRGWESIGKRKRTIVTLFGLEITYCRRGYRKNIDGRITYRYPLDELLGLKEGERFCPLTQEIAISLAARMPFREAAFILNHYLNVPVSHQAIHHWLIEAGRAREEELKRGEEAIFLDGEIPPAREKIDTLFIEADGVIVPLQRSKERQVELKLGVCHQGSFPTDPSKKRFALRNKLLWGGVMDASTFWERGSSLIFSRYQSIGKVVVNGDGADWVKEVKEYFPEAQVFLDRFHRNRALTQGLSFDPKLRQEAFLALRNNDPDGLKWTLARALIKAPSRAEEQKLRELKRYFDNNFEGLFYCQDDRLGAQEGQISHALARRMKRRGMSWTKAGAHHMANLRFLLAQGELEAWVSSYQKSRWPAADKKSLKEIASHISPSTGREDPSLWLRARIPVLATALVSSPLGEALKALSFIPADVA